MRQEINLLRGAVLALALVTIGVIISCGGSNSATAVQPPGIPTLYGDGSAGALVVTTFTQLNNVSDGNTQFTNISITGSGTLVVPSGTVLHCTGSFTVGPSALLRVETGGSGGTTPDDGEIAAGTVGLRARPATQGLSLGPAEAPEVGDTTALVSGGGGGFGLGSSSRLVRLPGPNAGGGGTGGCGNFGGEGGGGLTVLAFGAILVQGLLEADGLQGEAGSGGGAGGAVVLASAASIQVTGTVRVPGGDGGDSQIDSGAGGGGGGGIINLLAPSIAGVDGVNFVVAGGANGSNATNATAAFRSGGGGGGACGGNGGSGGGVDAVDSAGLGIGGSLGDINRITTADPVGLFP